MWATFSRPDSAVSMMTGMPLSAGSSLSFPSIVTPSITGMVMSRTMRSGFSRAATMRPSSPLAASQIETSWLRNVRVTMMRMALLSSTLRILAGINLVS